MEHLDGMILNVMVGLITILFAGICYFFKRLVNQLDRLTNKQLSLEIQFAHIKRDVSAALIAAHAIKDLEKAVAVLERNQATIFKRIDDLSERMSHWGSFISEIRRKGA